MPEHRPSSLSSLSSLPSAAAPRGAAAIVLRQARKLHKAARGGSLSEALPALRRLQAAGLFADRPLSALVRQRGTLQRKHFLRALALESGYAGWESLRPALDRMAPEDFAHFALADQGTPFLNTWFRNETEALAHVRAHGGRVLRVGRQAVVPAQGLLDLAAPGAGAGGDHDA